MDPRYLGLIELVLVFGAVLGFCVWQLRAVRRPPGGEGARPPRGAAGSAADRPRARLARPDNPPR
ncbi:MAG: hypothetical protein RQ752_01320 [Thermohalobaculum sp.]|nr:hypothetical protein [Thermohalobaculum sp.]